MGNWYKVSKRIHGRLYDYWQRTERQGGRVKTFNKYIGPHSTFDGFDGAKRWSNAAIPGVGVNNFAMMEARQKFGLKRVSPGSRRICLRQYSMGKRKPRVSEASLRAPAEAGAALMI